MGKLASVTCETIKPDPKRDRLIGDGDGLFLRVRPHGTKTWLIEYELQGRRTKYTIGGYAREGAPGESIPDWLRHGQQSLTQARSIAGAWTSMRRAGHDPVADWEALLARERAAEAEHLASLEAERNQPTVQDAIEIFMQKIMNEKSSAPAIRYRLERLAAIIGMKKIQEVTRQDVIAALDMIAEGQRKGQTAKQLAGEVLTTAKRLWRFAAEREWIRGVSPIEQLTRAAFGAKPTKRDVTLRMDELTAIWRTLDNPHFCKSDPVTIAAMKLLILTGQRESEVCEAEWAEFDLTAGLWRLPAERTKSGRAHLVHLAPQAVAILRTMELTSGKKYVFTSPHRPEQAIYGRSVNNALRTLFKSGKLSNVTRCHVHDFRRTFISRLPDLGFEPFLGHKIANHILSGVFAHYNHNSYEEKRKLALEKWAAQIELLAGGQNVSQFHQVA